MRIVYAFYIRIIVSSKLFSESACIQFLLLHFLWDFFSDFSCPVSRFVVKRTHFIYVRRRCARIRFLFTVQKRKTAQKYNAISLRRFLEMEKYFHNDRQFHVCKNIANGCNTFRLMSSKHFMRNVSHILLQHHFESFLRSNLHLFIARHPDSYTYTTSSDTRSRLFFFSLLSTLILVHSVTVSVMAT